MVFGVARRPAPEGGLSPARIPMPPDASTAKTDDDSARADGTRPRFALFDPYLAARSGHHCAFAAEVLNAAAKLGWEAAAAAHRRFRVGAAGFRIVPSFTERLWSRTIGGLALRFPNACSRRVRLVGSFRRDWVGRFMLSAAGKLDDMRRSARRAWDIARAERFARDASHAVRQLGLRNGDLAFLPNMTHVETLGLAALFASEPELIRGISWHLEYHYPPARSRDGHLDAADEEFAVLHDALQSLHSLRTRGTICCYTDTDELTALYNDLELFEFTTLPIPVCRDLQTPPSETSRQPTRETDSAGRPLKILYIGDSRTEKGFEWLPDLIHEVWPDLVAGGRVQFQIQSLINRRWKQASLVQTQRRLREFPAPQVQLFERPLAEDEYQSLIRNADMILLPYSTSAYSARSSGILAESLAAGVPVVVPAETWMSRQLEAVGHRQTAERPACSLPPSVPGIIYRGEVAGFAAALRQAVAEHDTIRQSACRIAGVWSSFHNPDQLVRELARRATGGGLSQGLAAA